MLVSITGHAFDCSTNEFEVYKIMSVITNVSVVLTASGQGERWHKDISSHKQLVPLPDGNPLIQRTINMVRALGCHDVYVATVHDEILKSIHGADMIHPSNCKALADTILSSSAVFSQRVVILLGDVFFSKEALNQIIQCEDAVRFFGKKSFAYLATRKGGRGGEIYALSFSVDQKETVIDALKKNSLNAAIQRRQLRLVRAFLRWKNGSFREHLRRVYPPSVPKIFRKIGFKPGRFWRLFRIVTGQSKGVNRYGKLWGLYLELTHTPVFYGQALSDPDFGAHLFSQIDDITQDIDYEEDYRELLFNIKNGSL